MIRIICATLLALAVHDVASSKPRTYEVMISHQFSDDETQAILEGMASWENVLPSLTFHLTPSFNGDKCPVPVGRTGSICVYPVDDADLDKLGLGDGVLAVTTTAGDEVQPDSPGAKVILIDVDRMRASNPWYRFAGVAAHELGHAMGLGHDPQQHTLMYPYVNHCAPDPLALSGERCYPVQAMTPQPRDVAAWRSLRY